MLRALPFNWRCRANGGDEMKTSWLMLAVFMWPAFPASAQYLTGANRAEFMRGSVASCMRGKANDPDMKVIPDSLVQRYCDCYSNGIADSVTVAQMQKNDPAADEPFIKREGMRCYQAMKDEALRLYKAGQYPKN
jgi:hypothetical protein